MPARVVVFLDYQNVYRRARDGFFQPLDPSQRGQVSPTALGQLICGRGVGDRTLAGVRVYRGQPDSLRDPTGYGANSRQCAAWSADPLTTVVVRTLRYPFNWPAERAQEKGIDVALAIDFVMMAIRGEYDIGVLMSTDTDLKPALEAIIGMAGGNYYPRCELAAWSVPGGHSRRLSVSGERIWCHWLSRDDYLAIADNTDYNLAP